MSSKFKKIKTDAALAVTGSDTGQGPTNAEATQTTMPVVKKRRIFKISKVKKSRISYCFFAEPTTSFSQKRNKGGEAAVLISDSHLQTSKKQRKIKVAVNHVRNLISDIKKTWTSKLEIKRARAGRVF